MKQYKIGDFAKYLGVTPDLLKHYEEQGLIECSRSDKGYRYYPFHMTSQLIEIIRLRNYGMTLRDIKAVVADHSVETDVVENRIRKNMENLRKEAELDLMLVEDYQDFLQWAQDLEESDTDWCIRRSRPMCFLPHTSGDQFLEDPGIYEVLKDWMSYIPIVKSAMKINSEGTMTWGLMISQDKLQQLGLPVSDKVEMIGSEKVFYFKFRGPIMRMEKLRDPWQHPALQRITDMNLTVSGSMYRVLVMPSDWKSGIRYQYGYYAIPLKI